MSMTSTTSSSDYLLLGLATCFIKQDGEVFPVQVIEPIPSATIETLVLGVPTSYEQVLATELHQVQKDDHSLVKPQEFPESSQFCDEFMMRAAAAVRTYQTHPESQSIVPLGSVRQDFNYSVAQKRVLKGDRTVRVEDNVKQHAYTHQTL